ncbi:MAG: transcription-repair coupling factor [Candidatus Aminicenantes bacterium]|nr:MAG: transcription-repair coupling factor [Candidatus Aminicenantes bacterium]
MSLHFLKQTERFQGLCEAIRSKKTGIKISGLVPSSKPYFLSVLSQESDKPIIFIRPTTSSIDRFGDECRFFLSQFDSRIQPAILPPLFDNPYQEIQPSLESVSTRMRFLHRLIDAPPSLLITNLPGLLKPIPRLQSLIQLFCPLKPGDPVGRDNLIQQLEAYGYDKQSLVNAHGECAWRGGIVDVFSPWEEYPYRIEFSGEEVVSLRVFRPSNQRTLKKVDRVLIPSLNEYSDPYFSVSFEHFYNDVLFLIDNSEETQEEWKKFCEDLTQQYDKIQSENKSCLPPDQIYPPGPWERIKKEALFLTEMESAGRGENYHFPFQSVPRFSNKIPFFLEYLKKGQEERERCLVYFSQEGVRQKLSTLLAQNQIPHHESSSPLVFPRDGSVTLLLGKINHGFRFPPEKITYFSETDIFTEEKVLVSRPRVRPFVSDFQDLKVDDYVVHTDYGIGIFKGLINLEVDEKDQEFISIHYRDDDKLFVPAEGLNLVQKYAHLGTASPLLNKLGTPAWEKTKTRIKKAVEKMAKQLLHLYAQRKTIRGHGYSPGGEWLTGFEKTFEYEETDDQLLAIKDIYRDMESASPMDRLLCGDVGYGKTEVAIRASFKAAMDGKQVAVLCPTTVLASQHLNTFRNRMVLFPINVESLTRLQSRVQQKAILEDMKKGLVDIVIGTHRLLSGDVEFRDLGLLIVDEEQRFGVTHKEKIKQMKANIDVLTMTATPIPRTLNISLHGLRDISLIETPPRDRLAIHTVVTPFSRKLISSAIKKELARGGQVYFIHNRVEDIETMARMIATWVPGAKVAVVHGKMSTHALEKRMIDFIANKYDVLVSTTIIENGIDIPLVNTLIVNRADRFGLGQLYQLRGRVGRSSRQAVAYFLVPPFSELTPLSKQRLKALQEFSQLGSGFRLAAKDLEIRGAGNFLGSQQHGCMEAVGFDYYMYLLEKTAKELKGERTDEVKTAIHLKVNIRIPDDYLPQTNLRLNLYKRISSIEAVEDMEKIHKEIIDRFGPLPQPVQNLMRYGVIKFLSQKISIKNIDRVGQKIVFTFFPTTTVDLVCLTDLLEKYDGSITPQGVMTIRLPSSDDASIMSETISFLKELSGM